MYSMIDAIVLFFSIITIVSFFPIFCCFLYLGSFYQNEIFATDPYKKRSSRNIHFLEFVDRNGIKLRKKSAKDFFLEKTSCNRFLFLYNIIELNLSEIFGCVQNVHCTHWPRLNRFKKYAFSDSAVCFHRILFNGVFSPFLLSSHRISKLSLYSSYFVNAFFPAKNLNFFVISNRANISTFFS